MFNGFDADVTRPSMVVICLLLLPPAPAYPRETPGLEKYSARELLPGICWKEQRAELLRRGEKAFLDFETILSDEEATPSEVARIFVVLRAVKANRSRFVKQAVRSMKHSDPEVRWHAIRLLEQIGSEKDTPNLYPMMTDPELVVRYAAPKAIAAIGRRRDLAKLNALRKANKFEDGDDYRAKLEKYLDEMKKRLDALDKAKGVVQPEP